MSVTLQHNEIVKFVKYFTKTDTFEKLAKEYCETFSREKAEKIILSFEDVDGIFKFNDPLVQDFFSIWVFGKIDKRDYILGKGKLAVAKGVEKDSGEHMVRLSNIEMFGCGETGKPIEQTIHDENTCQIDDVVIHCKSKEHAQKLYDAILDRD